MPMPEVFGVKIDNINESIDEIALRQFFGPSFQIFSIRVGENKTHAYVNFRTENDASDAVRRFNNKIFYGIKIRVSIAPKKDYKKVTDCKFGDLCSNIVSVYELLSLCQEQNKSTQVTNRTYTVIFTSYAIIKNGFALAIFFFLNRNIFLFVSFKLYTVFSAMPLTYCRSKIRLV